VITNAQLRAFGFSRDAIRYRVRRGRLVVWPGVYQVGRMPLAREGRFMAAVLACGEDAMLSHDSAAVLQRIRKHGGTHPIHISVPHDRRVRLDGIQPHRRSPMPPATKIGPIPTSQPLFTLIDLATTLETEDDLEAAINEAEKRGLIRFDEIEEQLAQATRYPGVGALKAILARYTRTDSNLERRFLALLRKHRLPLPATQEHIGPGRIDFHWPELNPVVETDGLTYHRTPMQQLEDRKRDQEHLAAGRTQIRIANVQIRESPAELAAFISRVVERVRARREDLAA